MSHLLRFALFAAVFGYVFAASPVKVAKPAAVIQPHVEHPGAMNFTARPLGEPVIINFTLIEPVEREEFGSLSREKAADADVQSIADSVKSQLEKQLGAGKVKTNKAIKFRRMSVDLARPGGGLTGGVVYYIKVEIAPGKYVHENIMLGGGDGAKLSSVEENHTLQDPIKEFFVFLKEIKA